PSLASSHLKTSPSGLLVLPDAFHDLLANFAYVLAHNAIALRLRRDYTRSGLSRLRHAANQALAQILDYIAVRLHSGQIVQLVRIGMEIIKKFLLIHLGARILPRVFI